MKEWLSRVFTTAGLAHLNWSWSIKLVQFHTGDGLTGDQNDRNWVSVGVSVGPADFPSQTKKESEALSETDGLCSSEHGLRGIGFGWSPIGYAGFVSCPKVQANFLLLCSSTNFVGYSYQLVRTSLNCPSSSSLAVALICVHHWCRNQLNHWATKKGYGLHSIYMHIYFR